MALFGFLGRIITIFQMCYRFLFCLILLMQVHASDRTNLSIDVLCDKRGLEVRLAFPTPFEGIIFSKGFYKDPLCRYGRSQRNETILTFDIAASNCGTRMKETSDAWTISNTLIIQRDYEIQTSMDKEVELTCELTNRTKRLTSFKDIQESETREYPVDAWLSIESLNADHSEIRIGDKLKVFIYIRDNLEFKNVLIKNCYAGSSHISEPKYLLLDEFGCSTEREFLTSFETFSSQSNVFKGKVAVADMTAFRFTDSDNLFLTCEVKICPTECTLCKQKPPNHIVKRSVEYVQLIAPLPSTENNFVLNHLMRITMDAFTSGLRSDKQRRIDRRLSPEYEGYDVVYEDSSDYYDTTEVPGITSTIPSGAAWSNLTLAPLNSEEINSTLPLQTTVTEEFNSETEPITRSIELNVTMSLRVLQSITKREVSESAYCFTQIHIIVLSVLATGLFCSLFGMCIFVFRFIRRERKKNLLNRFLLYSYS